MCVAAASGARSPRAPTPTALLPQRTKSISQRLADFIGDVVTDLGADRMLMRSMPLAEYASEQVRRVWDRGICSAQRRGEASRTVRA